MSDNKRTMILNMLKEGRISVEEADDLLKASETKPTFQTPDPGQMFKEGFSKLEGILKNVGSTVEAVAKSVAPVIEKQVDNFVSSIKSTLNKQQFTDQETIVPEIKIESIIIDNEWGDVNIVASERNDIELKRGCFRARGDVVEVQPSYEKAAQERAGELKVGWIIEGNRINFKMPELSTIAFTKDNLNINLFVPNYVSVRTLTRSGDIKINGINNNQAAIEAKTTSGDMDVKSLNVNELTMETVSGDISLKESAGNSLLKTTSGSINIEGDLKADSKIFTISGDIKAKMLVEETLEITTTSGDIEIKLQPDSKGSLILSSTSGDIYFTGESFNKININSVSGDIESNARVKEENNLEITSNSGEVMLKLMEDSHFTIAANTRNGLAECQMTLDNLEKGTHFFKGKFGDGAGQISLQSVTGNIIVNS